MAKINNTLWCLQVNLEVPQETRMWEDFIDCSREVLQGGSPNAHWSNIAMLTQKVICAVEQSAVNGCKTQKIKWWHWMPCANKLKQLQRWDILHWYCMCNMFQHRCLQRLLLANGPCTAVITQISSLTYHCSRTNVCRLIFVWSGLVDCSGLQFTTKLHMRTRHMLHTLTHVHFCSASINQSCVSYYQWNFAAKGKSRWDRQEWTMHSLEQIWIGSCNHHPQDLVQHTSKTRGIQFFCIADPNTVDREM